MITVLHNKNYNGYDFDKVVPSKDDLTLVADVETANLDRAYMLTNSIDTYWWDNFEVTKLFEGDGTRSTSVGDVLVVDGNAYIVAGCGFERWEEGDNICEEIIRDVIKSALTELLIPETKPAYCASMNSEQMTEFLEGIK